MSCNDIETSPNNEERKNCFGALSNFFGTTPDGHLPKTTVQSQPWKPTALEAPVLGLIVIVSLGVIAVLELLQWWSRRDGGILFAADVNELPLSKSFWYLYLPTIFAVLYSLLWSWVDLDAKRLEPYYQLSKSAGAKAEDSILLHYPFDFIASVPLKAIKRKHWPVSLASSAIVLVFWGLTPLQAGIFATETILRSATRQVISSNATLSLNEQTAQLSANYSYSVQSITWYNETLPAYMSKEFMLAPFRLVDEKDIQPSETVTAPTWKYGLDITCEKPTLAMTEPTPGREGFSLFINGSYYASAYHTTSKGCQVPLVYGFWGNETVDDVYDRTASIKQYTGSYATYDNNNGFANYYLSQYCPVNASHTFYVKWARSRATKDAAWQEPTVLFCEAAYHQQKVNATVRYPSMSVVEVQELGPKIALAEDVFNVTSFEWQTGSSVLQYRSRQAMPSNEWAQPYGRIVNMDLTLADLPYMVVSSVGAYPRPLEDYLDPDVLRKAYESAYRIHFARAMADVLLPVNTGSVITTGVRRYQIQAVVVVAPFAYAVEAILALVSIFAIGLIYLSITRPRRLSSDPSSLAATMALVANDRQLLEIFHPLDQATDKELEQLLQDRVYRLDRDESGSKLEEHQSMLMLELPVPSSARRLPGMWRGIRPLEFRWPIATTFLLFQATMIIVFAYLFDKGRTNGLRLPSRSQFVRQLLENFVPTAIATFIEPIWVVWNRLLCMLQPFEELRKGNAATRKSLTLNYMSVPPQLVFPTALKARHYVLAAVCSMALLSNLLAVSLSSLFFEGTKAMHQPVDLMRPYPAQFPKQPGWETNSAISVDHIYWAMSNMSSGTPLAPWTDRKSFYQPFLPQRAFDNGTYQIVAETRALGADLDCFQLNQGGSNMTIEMIVGPDDRNTTIYGTAFVTFSSTEGSPTICSTTTEQISNGVWDARSGHGYGSLAGCPTERTSAEIIMMMAANETSPPACNNMFVVGWVRNSKQDVCRMNATKVDLSESTFMACKPKLRTSTAQIRTDIAGHILSVNASNTATTTVTDVDSMFADPIESILALANGMILNNATRYQSQTNAQAFHTDAYPSDFLNYLLMHSSMNSSIVDPAASPPKFEDVSVAFQDLYQQLFALWMGTYIFSQMKVDVGANETTQFKGTLVVPETRILISRPMLIISQTILGLYMVTAVLLYFRRPGRFLPRLPTTIAGIVACFAASHAVKDFRGTENMNDKEREKWLDALAGHGQRDRRYGFGDFVGVDGKPHVGIEREPLVSVKRRKADVVKQADVEVVEVRADSTEDTTRASTTSVREDARFTQYWTGGRFGSRPANQGGGWI